MKLPAVVILVVLISFIASGWALRRSDAEDTCFKQIFPNGKPSLCPKLLILVCVKDWDGKFRTKKDGPCEPVKWYQCVNRELRLPKPEVVPMKYCITRMEHAYPPILPGTMDNGRVVPDILEKLKDVNEGGMLPESSPEYVEFV